MNMSVMKWICIASVTTALTTAAANGQQEVVTETKVITLRNVDAITVVSAIQELSIEDLDTVSSAARVNKVIVQGSRSAVELVESIIMQLDRLPEGGGQLALLKTEFVPVRSYPLADMHDLVHTALDLDGPTRIAADEINRRIVVTGTLKDIEAVRSLVAHLDRPRKTYTIELFFIRSLGDNTDDVKIAPLPKAMAPIAKSLGESGFGTLTLMAPMIMRVDDGQSFEQQVRHTIRHPGDLNEPLRLSVSGVVQSVPDSDVLQIQLQATMVGTSSERGSSDAFFDITTNLSIPERRFAVLAAAPASTRNGDAIALVIHVKTGSLD